MGQKSQEFNRVGECLLRNGNKVYFALLKVRGKQIRRSLKTNDLALAKRRLAELREKTKRQTDKGNRNIRFEELAELWLASIKPDLKKSSYDRRVVAVTGLKSQLAGKTRGQSVSAILTSGNRSAAHWFRNAATTSNWKP